MKSLHLTRPHAIMMVGIPGSGKSFFARQFADTFGAPYLDSLSVEQFSRDSEASGQLIGLFLEELAKTKQTFLYEGNGDTRTGRTEFARWARGHGYQPLFIWVQADQATSLSRSLRAGSLDREQFAGIIRQFSPPHPDEKALVISGKHTYASQAKVVLSRLSQENRPEAAPVSAPARPASDRPRSGRVIVQ